MNLNQIKDAVALGLRVHWMNENYIVKSETNRTYPETRYYILCVSNSNIINLTHIDGVTMNGAESDFYIGTRF